MARCPFRRFCGFFLNQMENLPGTAGMYRQRFCLDKPSACARYAVYRNAGREQVPVDLLPFEHDRVETILKARMSA